MQDALLNRTLRLTIVGTVSMLCVACLILCYGALFDSLGGNVAMAGHKLIWGLAAGSAGFILGRWRNELIDT